MRIILRLVASVVLYLLSLGSQAGEIKILIRYDDYSKFSNTQLERSLLSAVESLGGGVVVGVIPFPYAPHPGPETVAPRTIDLNGAKIRMLNDYVSRGSAAIAVHGYSHINTATSGLSSELPSLPEADQLRLLTAAKGAAQRAFGRDISLFTPAFNKYSTSTLHALEDSGYTMLSSGALAAGQSSGRLRYLPGSVYAQQLKGVALKAAGKAHADGIIVATVHSYDFTGFGEPFPAFRKNSAQIRLDALVEDLQTLKAVAGIRIVSLAELEQSGEDLSAQRLQVNSSLLGSFVTRHKLLPVFLGLYPSAGVYYTQEAARSLRTWQVLASIVLYASLFSAIGLAAMRLLRSSGRAAAKVAWSLLFLSIAGMAMLVPKFVLGPYYMGAAVALTCCAGLFAAAVRHRLQERQGARRASPVSTGLEIVPPPFVARVTEPGGL